VQLARELSTPIESVKKMTLVEAAEWMAALRRVDKQK
jgi:hypothetical protein